MLGEEPPGPGQRIGRRLVAGEDQSHHFVTELLVGHPGAITLFVARAHQHREEVTAIASVTSMLRDDLVDRRIEDRQRATRATHARERPVVHPVTQQNEPDREGAEHLGERLPHHGGFPLQVDVEEGSPDDIEGEVVHRPSDVEALPIGPPRHHREGTGHHHIRVPRDALAMERRLGEPALPEMEFSLAREKSVPEDESCALEPQPLPETARLPREHLLHEVGM